MIKTHSFTVEIAVNLGINKAILLEHIAYWIKKNISNEKNFYDGRYWTYNSKMAFKNIFPYMSEATIARNLCELEKQEYIISGNFNKNQMDRTKWYSLTNKAEMLFGIDEFRIEQINKKYF